MRRRARSPGRWSSWYRHATVAARILALFVAFLMPALLLYPSIDFFAERATRRLITTQYAVEAQKHPQTLQERLTEARDEIDALPVLPGPRHRSHRGAVRRAAHRSARSCVWSQTALARARLTSAIELYDRDGDLVSRFALNFPEYTGSAQQPRTARFPASGTSSARRRRSASEERSMLHAERSICATPPRKTAAACWHHRRPRVPSTTATLPFISSQSPVLRAVPSGRRARTASKAPPDSDVDVAIYGWGLHADLHLGPRRLADHRRRCSQRIYAVRATPFWATVPRGNGTWRGLLLQRSALRSTRSATRR